VFKLHPIVSDKRRNLSPVHRLDSNLTGPPCSKILRDIIGCPMDNSLRLVEIPAFRRNVQKTACKNAASTDRIAFMPRLSWRTFSASTLTLILGALCGASAMASVTPSPASYSWASVPVGGKGGQKVVTLSNSGSAAISISSIAFSGADPGDFEIFSKTCSTSLAASASCTVNVLFAPTTAGTRTATLDFNDNGTGSPQTVALSGLGTSTTGSVTNSPSTLSFGTVYVGSSSAAQTGTLSNGTASSISISNVAITGTNAGDFSIASKTCGASLSASGSCTASIVFKPTAAGSRSATLSFTDSATNSPQSIALTGTGSTTTSGSASVSPTSYSWASVAVGGKGGQKIVTLTNSGTSTLSISGLSLTGTNPGDFEIFSKTCGSSLAASASCTANIIFGPTASGDRYATLNFNDSASNSPQTVALSGYAPGGASGSVSASPASVTFGSTAVGSSSSAQTATLSNGTSSSITIGSVSISGTNAGDFSIASQTCGTSLAASASCTASIVFKPTATGTRTATLSFADSASNSPQTVSLSGTGGGGASSGSLTVYPSSAAVAVGTQQVFQAQLSTVPDSNSLSYSIDGVSGGNSTTGTVTNLGVYTAPSVAGSHELVVKDNSLGTTSNSWITVYSNVTVDFGSRATNSNPVAAGLFGAQYLEALHDAADLDMVKAGGFTSDRTYAGLTTVFATSTPNWSTIDGTISRITAGGGVHVLLEMFQMPPWLQQNNCGVYSLPSNLTEWASIAQQYVAHMDATFPGVVTDYEIWNEPNLALCVPSGDDVLTDYMKLYAAAAPVMKAQAKADGQTIRVGGPVTAGILANWITAMLNDPTVSQNIDFLSYHNYLMGLPGAKAEWDTYNGVESVYQATQDKLGPANFYEYMGSLAAQGKQPQGKNLPIYITEYNLDWEFTKTCCSNDFTYGPLWNALWVADLLDAPFAYSGAPNSLGRMDYYAASAKPYYCLIGEYDANMDCAYPTGSTPQPYPQLFAYQLFGSPSYLGLQNGAYMAKSMSPPRLSNGLVVSAFFTPSLDAIVLINPSQYTYTNMAVNISNSGLTSPVGTLYQIVNGQSIQSSTVSLQSQGGTSYSTSVTLAPYSVQAISLHH